MDHPTNTFPAKLEQTIRRIVTTSGISHGRINYSNLSTPDLTTIFCGGNGKKADCPNELTHSITLSGNQMQIVLRVVPKGKELRDYTEGYRLKLTSCPDGTFCALVERYAPDEDLAEEDIISHNTFHNMREDKIPHLIEDILLNCAILTDPHTAYRPSLVPSDKRAQDIRQNNLDALDAFQTEVPKLIQEIHNKIFLFDTPSLSFPKSPKLAFEMAWDALTGHRMDTKKSVTPEARIGLVMTGETYERTNIYLQIPNPNVDLTSKDGARIPTLRCDQHTISIYVDKDTGTRMISHGYVPSYNNNVGNCIETDVTRPVTQDIKVEIRDYLADIARGYGIELYPQPKGLSTRSLEKV